MPIQLFNLNYYIAEASASNPDEAVVLTHTTGYAVNASPTDRLFVQRSGHVVVAGGLVQPTAVASSKILSVTGPSPNRNQAVVVGMRLFEVRGGGRLAQPKVFSQNASLYAITT